MKIKPLVRWTIGPVKPQGFDCLLRSIETFISLYDVEVMVCHNGLTNEQVSDLSSLPLLAQTDHIGNTIPPMGVAWKLYPARLALDRHELFIDNDLIVEQKIAQIDDFFAGNKTLLLECESRSYGQFDRHVPPGYCINSGLFGVPPHFDLAEHINFFVRNWEENSGRGHELSKTFDEQGIVAAILTNKPHLVIPNSVITNCENALEVAKGMHFIGLNRVSFHRAYADFKASKLKLFL